jgi:cytoskeletal protein RodZ
MDDFGGKLRQARERRGISLRQIAASTKITSAALEALERNDISKLPGGIFSRAFVRCYAIEVGLDPDETVAEFLERFNQEPAPTADAGAAAVPEEERAFHERQRKAQRVAMASALVFILAIVGLVFAYRARTARHRGEQGALQAVASAVETQLRLDIQPAADCWVSVTADGRKIFARVVRAGEKETVTIIREATVDVGDAEAFAYAINGKPGKTLGTKGQMTTLTLTPATAAQFIR